jgi:hypothetical protein
LERRAASRLSATLLIANLPSRGSFPNTGAGGPLLPLIALLRSWRRPMKATVLAVTFTLTFVAASHASPQNVPTSRAATRAFGQLLHQRYGEVHGFWTCPGAQIVKGPGITCLAEVRAGSSWHRTSATAILSGGHILFSQRVDTAWRRHWWPYSRHFILRSNEPQVPGVISVNSPAYDWGFLAECAQGLTNGSRRCDAYDGDGTGLFRFFNFTCSGHAGLVTCTNALGDSMRYRPHPG